MDTDSSPFSENAGLHDILLLVFTRLDSVSLYAAAATCKLWHGCAAASRKKDGAKFKLNRADLVCAAALLEWAKKDGFLPALDKEVSDPYGMLGVRMTVFAVSVENLASLQWLRANGYPWGGIVCNVAASSGNQEMLRWCYENGAPWDEWACLGAIEGGHLGILRWVIANGCPWHMWSCVSAAKAGRLEILRWARENGCPWDKGSCLAIAEKDSATAAWIAAQPE